jgi:MFS family permease
MSSTVLRTAKNHWLARRLPFYYGWLILPMSILAAFATSPGQTFMVSVFNPSLRDALSLSLSQLTGAYMLGTILASLPQPYIGYWSDRVGIRRMLVLVVVFFSLACIFIAQAENLLMLTTAFFFLRMFGQGALNLLSNNMLPMWFSERLGRVSGIKKIILDLMIGSVPIGVLAAIKQFGWRETYILAGVIVVSIMLPLAVFVFVGRPEDIGEQIEGGVQQKKPRTVGREMSNSDNAITLKEAMRHRAYWILIISSIAFSGIVTAITFNLLPIFSELGFSQESAAGIFSLLMITSAISQILGGVLADRITLKWLLVGALVLFALGVSALIILPPNVAAVSYMLTFGLGLGLFGGLNNTVWVRYFGRSHLGKIQGSVSTAMVAGSSVGPFLMGLAFDSFGSFQFSLIVIAIMLVILAVIGIWATPPRLPDPTPDPVLS